MTGEVNSVALTVGLSNYQEAFSGSGLNVLCGALYHIVKGVGNGAVSGNEKADFRSRQFLEKRPVKGPEGLLQHFLTHL